MNVDFNDPKHGFVTLGTTRRNNFRSVGVLNIFFLKRAGLAFELPTALFGECPRPPVSACGRKHFAYALEPEANLLNRFPPLPDIGDRELWLLSNKLPTGLQRVPIFSMMQSIPLKGFPTRLCLGWLHNYNKFFPQAFSGPSATRRYFFEVGRSNAISLVKGDKRRYAAFKQALELAASTTEDGMLQAIPVPSIRKKLTSVLDVPVFEITRMTPRQILNSGAFVLARFNVQGVPSGSQEVITTNFYTAIANRPLGHLKDDIGLFLFLCSLAVPEENYNTLVYELRNSPGWTSHMSDRNFFKQFQHLLADFDERDVPEIYFAPPLSKEVCVDLRAFPLIQGMLNKRNIQLEESLKKLREKRQNIEREFSESEEELERVAQELEAAQVEIKRLLKQAWVNVETRKQLSLHKKRLAQEVPNLEKMLSACDTQLERLTKAIEKDFRRECEIHKQKINRDVALVEKIFASQKVEIVHAQFLDESGSRIVVKQHFAPASKAQLIYLKFRTTEATEILVDAHALPKGECPRIYGGPYEISLSFNPETLEISANLVVRPGGIASLQNSVFRAHPHTRPCNCESFNDYAYLMRREHDICLGETYPALYHCMSAGDVFGSIYAMMTWVRSAFSNDQWGRYWDKFPNRPPKACHRL